MEGIGTLISTVGFPIVACIGLAYFCKYMIDQNNKHIEKMFDLYDKANKENREAIEANTKVIAKLCEALDKEEVYNGDSIKFGD